MQVFEGSASLSEAERGCVLTIGNFDGLHRGHQALLREVRARAEATRVPGAVYTFDPHPRRVLEPERDQPRLMTREQLTEGLEEAGIDLVIFEPFTAELAALSADAFLEDLIARRIAPSEILVGRDFHFGKGRGGSGETLMRIGPTLGIRIGVIPQVALDGTDVSSTRVRQLLASGGVEEARHCLGRPYTIWGRVVEGDRRGRLLGFPTANLEPENELVPARGVYATLARVLGEGGAGPAIPSVTNIGTRPTFAPGRILTEAHLLDFQGDLYGRRLALGFVARLRDERSFPGPEALAAQIARDVAAARELLRPDVP